MSHVGKWRLTETLDLSWISVLIWRGLDPAKRPRSYVLEQDVSRSRKKVAFTFQENDNLYCNSFYSRICLCFLFLLLDRILECQVQI